MLSPAESRLIYALKQRKTRSEKGLFLAEGVRVVEEALNAGIDLRIAAFSPSLEDTDRGRALLSRLEQTCEVREVSDAELLKAAATETPQGVLLVGATPRVDSATLQVPADRAVLLLDGVQDPGNFGTLVRTADAFGAAAVIALDGTVDPWNPKAVRAAAGSSFHVPLLQLSHQDALSWLNERGVTIYTADARGPGVGSVPITRPAALVVGNEGAGVSDVMRDSAHASLAIPIRGRAESLNVSIAAGILLYLMTVGANNA